LKINFGRSRHHEEFHALERVPQTNSSDLPQRLINGHAKQREQ